MRVAQHIGPRSLARRLVVLGILLPFGCIMIDNPEYCLGNPQDPRCASAGHKMCKVDKDCSAPDNVCDTTGTMTCVQCTPAEPAACGGTSPICGSTQCQPCSSHAQCVDSNVCLPDGSCADKNQVAYVAPGGIGTTCTQEQPCGTLDDGVQANQPYVKIEAATGTGGPRVVADDQGTTIDGKAVTILADPEAKLSRSVPGVILTVQNDGADVKIFDLEITLGTGLVNPAISIPAGGSPKLGLTRVTVDGNQGVGILASAGTLALSHSTISNNTGGGISSTGGTLTVSQSTISGNQGGGLSIPGATTFDIENNFIIYNGLALGPGASPTGGASVVANTAGSKFEFNTIAFNQSSGLTFRGGISCNAPLVAASLNLIYRNTEADGLGGMKTDAMTQFNPTGGCQFGNTLAVPTDANNLGFKSPLVMPYDFHLTASSPSTIVNAGGTCTGVDFDGDPRPIGPACDLGADEYRP